MKRSANKENVESQLPVSEKNTSDLEKFLSFCFKIKKTYKARNSKRFASLAQNKLDDKKFDVLQII